MATSATDIRCVIAPSFARMLKVRLNELVEAKQNNQVRKLMSRWQKYELIALDEVGYVPLADIGAEFLFNVTSAWEDSPKPMPVTVGNWTKAIAFPRVPRAFSHS